MFIHDPEDRRVAKLSGPTVTNEYLFDTEGNQQIELNGSGTVLHTNLYAGGKLLATYQSTNTYFHFTDWLGTPRYEANSAGAMSETCTNLPFGDSQVCTGTPDATEHHFTGKEHDTESGLDYFGARYYANVLGRFVTPDWAAKPAAVPYAGFDDPQSLNLYAYVKNGPLSATDADGHCSGDECQNVKATIKASPPRVVQNQKAGDRYQTGIGTTVTVKLTDKGKPLAGVSVKESPTTTNNLTGNTLQNKANPEPVTTSKEGTIKDNVTAVLRSDSQPHEVTPQDTQDIKDAGASLPYDRTTDQILMFSVGGQTCTCTYSETLSNVDSQGNLNTQTNSQGTTFTFDATKPVVQSASPAPSEQKEHK
jgi:RHS repeat-associated protein